VSRRRRRQPEANGEYLSSRNSPPSEAPAARWPYITALLAKAGHITIGHIAPIEAAAVAADEHTLLATLVRRPGESVDDLLGRLDYAIGQALNHGIHANEIEGGHFVLGASRQRKK